MPPQLLALRPHHSQRLSVLAGGGREPSGSPRPEGALLGSGTAAPFYCGAGASNRRARGIPSSRALTRAVPTAEAVQPRVASPRS